MEVKVVTRSEGFKVKKNSRNKSKEHIQIAICDCIKLTNIQELTQGWADN